MGKLDSFWEVLCNFVSFSYGNCTMVQGVKYLACNGLEGRRELP